MQNLNGDIKSYSCKMQFPAGWVAFTPEFSKLYFQKH